MAHFTGHPYHTMPAIRPSQPLPLSPPETDRESFHPQVPTACVGTELDQLPHPTSGIPERSKIQYRKSSALPYQSSVVRDSRDRTLSRGSRNLIIVFPPPDFPLDHGHLGNVLSMGPRHRLSQGILIPLFPTMYGQLTAIAHEFNFPSTVGLCLYHHITDNGITMTPRISDDAWQYLWGHLFEPRLPSNGSQQLPISGRLEFDIDLKKARWFDAWLAGTLRDETIIPAPLSYTPIHHWPEDSRSIFAEEHIINEDRWDNQTVRSTTRHVPRKLSLVDRLDSAALQHSYKASQAVAPSPPLHHVMHHLSPIPQSAVPQPSKAELHQRVNSWRANASLDPASMAESYQPFPKGTGAVALVDTYPLEEEVEAQEPLNLADFSWSVTSAGPLSPPLDSPTSLYRLPSVHLDRRMEEFVPLTPTTATSWGPKDDDWLSVASSVSRLPSPDIGARMIENVPLTSTTAASCGPADDWRSDVSSIDRLPCPDIAYGVLEDAAVNQTPGPWHLVWPRFEVKDVSPSVTLYSPWAGMSASLSSWFDVTKAATVPSTTSYNFWSRMKDQGFELNSAVSWPWFNIHASQQTGAQSKSNPGLERSMSINPWAGMPRFNMGSWHDVNGSQPCNSVVVSLNQSGDWKPRYPNLDLYPATYPYFDINPAYADVGQSSHPSSAGAYPILDIYPAVYPHFYLYPSITSIISPLEKPTPKSVDVKLHLTYPLFNLYPPLYPYNLSSVYPAVATAEESSSQSLPSSYPWLTIYSPVYPHVIPYPQAGAEIARPGEAKPAIAQLVQMKLPSQYPIFDIYLAVYPWNLDAIYPPTKAEDASTTSVQLRSNYPWLTIYPPIYPHVVPYPQASAEMTRPREAKGKLTAPVRVKLPPQYPVLDIYPAVYPWSLDTIYPWIKDGGTSDITVRLLSHYPWLCIYPSVYPFVEPYPTLSRTSKSPGSSPTSYELGSVKVSLDRYYPAFDLYPAGYSHFDLYPALPDIISSSSEQEQRNNSAKTIIEGVSVDLAGTYPYICPYPPAYPHFGMYPHVQIHAAPDGKNLSKGTSFVSSSTYPFLVIYHPMYPHFDLYPMRTAEPTTREESKAPVTTSSYPHLVVYPPIYPYLDLYPSIPPRIAAPAASTKSGVRMYHRYPVLNIYPAVYPHFDIYPILCSVVQPPQGTINTPAAELQTGVATSPLAKQRPSKTKAHHQLHDEVFVKGVVWTPSGYVQDLVLFNEPHEQPGPRRRQPSVQEVGPRLARSRSGTLANQTPSSSSLRARQSQALPNVPLQTSSPGVLAVSEFPAHISQSLPASPTLRASQGVRFIGLSPTTGTQGRNLADDYDEKARSPRRSMSSSFDRRGSMIPSLSTTGHNRPSVHEVAQGLVLQRARAYEQSTVHSRHQSYNMRSIAPSAP